MKKFIVLALSISIIPFAGFAQEPVDSTKSQTLGDVVVQAQMQKTSAKVSTYIPSSKQKNASIDATDLLNRMAIPQLSIDPRNGTVTTAAGDAVSVYIDYIPATEQDLTGMKTTDVKYVEILESPTDPRFQGDRRVVHFIMKKYEVGGYTKLSTSQTFLNSYTNREEVFSKLVYKKMTFDLFARVTNFYCHHTGDFAEENYLLSDGLHTRTVEPLSSTTHQTNIPFSLRAVYRSDKVQVTNLIGGSFLYTPKFDNFGQLSIVPSQQTDYSFSDYYKSNNYNFSYDGSILVSLPRDWSLLVRPMFAFSRRTPRETYNSTATTDAIVNDVNEDSYDAALLFQGSKKFNKSHTLDFIVKGAFNRNKVHYLGSNPYNNNFESPSGMGMLSYTYEIDKFYAMFDAGISYERVNINGEKETDIYPTFNVDASYSPNNKHQIRFYGTYYSDTPSGGLRSPNVIQQNEFIYATGNTDLNPTRKIRLTADYTWLQSNKFQMLLFASYSREFKRLVHIYTPYLDGGAVLRTYENNGDYIDPQLGLQANLKLLNGNLIIKGSGLFQFFKSTGVYDVHKVGFYGNLSTTYYFGNFSLSAFCSTTHVNMDSSRPAISREQINYYLRAGWGNAKWNINLSFNNPFAKTWVDSRTHFSSPYYSYRNVSYNIGNHQNLVLTVAYTFGYGKEVRRGDEIGEQAGASSAILR